MKRTLVIVLALMACAGMVLAQDAPPASGSGGSATPPRPGTSYAWRGGQTALMSSSPSTALNPPSVQFVTRGATALALTQEQTDKLTALLTKSNQELTALRQKLQTASQALRNAVVAPTYDAAKVKQLLAEAQAADTAVINAELQTWSDFRAVLTADHLGKLASILGQRPSFGGFGGTRSNPGNRPGGGNTPPPAGPPPAPVPAG